jgi:hypothetical protein
LAEDEMLFAWTGIALPDGDGTSSIYLTRILTFARLVMVLNEKGNIDDKLRVRALFPFCSVYSS